MSFELINAEVCRRVMETINVGDTVALVIDDTVVHRKVLEKSAYMLTVQGPTNKLSLAVAFTEQYRKEVEAMGTKITGGEPGAARPGRPKGSTNKARATGPAAPVTQTTQRPVNNFLPPGSKVGPTAGAVAPWAVQPAEQEQQPAQQDDAPEGSYSAEWAKEQAAEICTRFAEDIQTLLEAVATDAASNAQPAEAVGEYEPPPVRLTCGDCQHINFAGDICDKFNSKPPIKIILNPVGECPGFEQDEIPF